MLNPKVFIDEIGVKLQMTWKTQKPESIVSFTMLYFQFYFSGSCHILVSTTVLIQVSHLKSLMVSGFQVILLCLPLLHEFVTLFWN